MTAQTKKQRVLLCEDEYIIVMQLRRTLQRSGYEVVGETSDGEKAVEMAAQLRPDLILMDINLRGSLSGIEATRRILEDGFVPILILSAHSDREYIDEALGAGAWSYVLKPIDSRQLVSVIAEVVAHFDRIQVGMEAIAEIKKDGQRQTDQKTDTEP